MRCQQRWAHLCYKLHMYSYVPRQLPRQVCNYFKDVLLQGIINIYPACDRQGRVLVLGQKKQALCLPALPCPFASRLYIPHRDGDRCLQIQIKRKPKKRNMVLPYHGSYQLLPTPQLYKILVQKRQYVADVCVKVHCTAKLGTLFIWRLGGFTQLVFWSLFCWAVFPPAYPTLRPWMV